MSFGTSPFGFFPAGQAYSAGAAEVRSSLSSSRKIDGRTRRYVANDEGGFEAMDDVAQIVLLRVSFAVKLGPLISPQSQAATRNAIRVALDPMTKGNEPSIKVLRVDVSDDGKATSYVRVTYRNLKTGTIQTVEPS